MNRFRLTDDARPFMVSEAGERRSVMLRQLIATRPFGDVMPGTPGGWVEHEHQLSQHGSAWLYHHNSLMWGNARLTGDARLYDECLVGPGAQVGGHAELYHCQLMGPLQISGHAHLRDCVIAGHCLIADAPTLEQCQINGAPRPGSAPLRIDGQARLLGCRVTHQARVGESAELRYALVGNRAAVYGEAQILGSDLNHIWICDCAQVYDRARLLAGDREGDAPVLRYGARVFGEAEIRGDCLLRQRVQVSGRARLLGGPLVLDGQVSVDGDARLEGNIVVEDSVIIGAAVTVRASNGDLLHIRGPRVLDGATLIVQTPFYGLY